MVRNNKISDSILVSEYIGGKEASLSILINRHKQRFIVLFTVKF